MNELWSWPWILKTLLSIATYALVGGYAYWRGRRDEQESNIELFGQLQRACERLLQQHSRLARPKPDVETASNWKKEYRQ